LQCQVPSPAVLGDNGAIGARARMGANGMQERGVQVCQAARPWAPLSWAAQKHSERRV